MRPYWAISGDEHARPAAGPPCRVRAEDGADAWLFTRFEDVRAVLADPRFSADPARPGYPCGPGHRGASTTGSLIRMDGARHQRLRRRLAAEFSLARIARYEPLVKASAEEAVDRLLGQGPGADFVSAVAKPAAIGVAAGLLGIPAARRERFIEEVRHLHDPGFPAGQRTEADRRLRDHLAALLAERRERPSDDLLGRLAHRDPAAAAQTVLDVRLILAAGVQTTSSMIGLTALSILDREPRRRGPLSDPDRLAAVVEEALRYWSVVQTGPRRVAREPVRVGGRSLAAGVGAIVCLPAANRDREAFEGEVETANLDMPAPRRRHLAFGYGPHQCLGQNFARIVLRGVFEVVLARIPDLRLAEPRDTLRFTDHAVIFGLERLRVAW
jgi:cytochrome P450